MEEREGLFQLTVLQNTLREVSTGTGDRNRSRGHGGTQDRPASSGWPSYFSNTAQDHLPRDGTACISQALFYQLVIQGKCHTDVPTGQSDGINSSTEVSSSNYVKLTTKISPQAASDPGLPCPLVMGHLGCPLIAPNSAHLCLQCAAWLSSSGHRRGDWRSNETATGGVSHLAHFWLLPLGSNESLCSQRGGQRA